MTQQPRLHRLSSQRGSMISHRERYCSIRTLIGEDDDMPLSAHPSSALVRQSYPCPSPAALPTFLGRAELHSPNRPLQLCGVGSSSWAHGVCNSQGSDHLAMHLAVLKIETLDLSDNDLSDADAKKFCASLSMNNKLRKVDLSGNKLRGREFAPELASLVRTTDVEAMRLSSNKLRRPLVSALVASLCEMGQASPLGASLTELDLHRNELCERCGGILGNIFECGNRLQILRLGWNRLHTRGAKALLQSLAINAKRVILRELDLPFNALNESEELEDALETILTSLPSLKLLNLSHNALGRRCAMKLAKALERNSTLQDLNMGHNPLGFDGAAALIGCVLPPIDWETQLQQQQPAAATSDEDKEQASFLLPASALRSLSIVNAACALSAANPVPSKIEPADPIAGSEGLRHLQQEVTTRLFRCDGAPETRLQFLWEMAQRAIYRRRLVRKAQNRRRRIAAEICSQRLIATKNNAKRKALDAVKKSADKQSQYEHAVALGAQAVSQWTHREENFVDDTEVQAAQQAAEKAAKAWVSMTSLPLEVSLEYPPKERRMRHCIDEKEQESSAVTLEEQFLLREASEIERLRTIADQRQIGSFKEVVHVAASIFAARSFESDSGSFLDRPLLKASFDVEWRLAERKLKRFVPDDEVREEVRALLCENYERLASIFRLYSSRSLPHPTALNVSDWNFLLGAIRIKQAKEVAHRRGSYGDERCTREATDLIFRECNNEFKDLEHYRDMVAQSNSAERSVGHLTRGKTSSRQIQQLVSALDCVKVDEDNPSDALTRFEFLEALVRLAYLKYCTVGERQRGHRLLMPHELPPVSVALRSLLFDHLLRWGAVLDGGDDFRTRHLYYRDVHLAFAAVKAQVMAVFKHHCGRDEAAGAHHLLGLSSWMRLVTDCGLVSGDISTLSVRRAFLFSNMDVVCSVGRTERQLKRDSLLRLTFTEFLEAIALLAKWGAADESDWQQRRIVSELSMALKSETEATEEARESPVNVLPKPVCVDDDEVSEEKGEAGPVATSATEGRVLLSRKICNVLMRIFEAHRQLLKSSAWKSFWLLDDPWDGYEFEENHLELETKSSESSVSQINTC